MKQLLGLLLLFIVQASQATIYYVSPSGSSSNTGTSANNAWPMQYAADRTNPGDTVYFLSGTYTITYDVLLSIERSGTLNNYITYKPAPGNTPVIQSPNPCYAWNGIKVKASYIIIEGLELIGNNANLTIAKGEANYSGALAGGQDWYNYSTTNTNGIYIAGDELYTPHHIVIRNCKVHDFAGGGIGTERADFITIENNIVYNNSWYTMYAGSGISLFHSQNTLASYTGYANTIRNNIIYNNKTLVKWLVTQDYSDGNGLIIDDNKNTQINNGVAYNGRTLVENNISYSNGAGGLHIYSSRNVDIVNNSTYKNSYLINYGEMDAVDCNNIRFYNNILYASQGKNVNLFYNSSNVLLSNNIYYNGIIQTTGTNDLIADPKYITPSGNNFHLQSNSPAIDAGYSALAASADIESTTRPQGIKVDIGAYESAAIFIHPLSVAVSPSQASVVGSVSVQLSATILPANVMDTIIFWSSADTSIATVNQNGLVTGGTLAGSVSITATTQDGRVTGSSLITVNLVPVSGIFVNPSTETLAAGGRSKLLTATVLPGNANDKKVVWVSSNPGIVSVDSTGLITGITAGNAIITATTRTGGFASSSNITVSPAANSLSGAFVTSIAPVNLTMVGLSDWKHFFNNSHKAIGTMINKISNYTAIGGNGITYNDDPRKFSWTGGIPTPSSTNNTNGIYIAGLNKGFSYTIKAGIGTNKFYLYMGGWNSGAKLTVRSSNADVADYINTTITYPNEWGAVYTITYIAAQANDTITVKWIQSSGSGNVTLQAAAFVNDPSVLPVHFLSFTATQKDKLELVEWATADEINTGHFEIEHSEDGVIFTTIGNVLAKGYGTTYQFEDLNPKSGNNFYRIKSIDKDGRFQFSKIIKVVFKSFTHQSMVIYPNPVRSEMDIKIPSLPPGKYFLSINDVMGVSLTTYSIESIGLPLIIHTNVTGLSSGLGIIKLFSKEEMVSVNTILIIK